jgi:hypothetical protein
VSESGLSRDDAGARLRSHAADGEYVIDLPDAQEPARGGTVLPQSTLPWRMPWRVIAIGSLRTIAESMLGVDVAIPSRTTPQAWIVPGKAAWSWPLLGDSSANFATQQRFIDYAADMRWRYVLVDAGWDVLIGATRIPELVAYANSRGVKLLLWYNSAGDWNTTPQTPRSRLLTHDDRVREFTWLHQAGVAGVKVDFFGSDAQGMIAYYHDILEDAAPFHLLVNFHGATLPRGWQRTYPHLMTMEAIKGLEFVTFDQRNADEEPRHATVIPFTRNVFDPMDFTPMVLDRIRNIERRTTSAFELALSVLFTSGIQHYAEIPDGMAKVPEFVRDFLRHVPSVWDDVRFLDGYPGSYVVMARRSGNRWYVSGINGDTIDRHLSLDLRILGKSGATLISDGDSHSFRADTLPLSDRGHVQLTLKPRGGFVLVTH